MSTREAEPDLLPAMVPFGSSFSASLACFLITTSTRAFACANHTTHPSPLSVPMLTDFSIPSRFRCQPYDCGALSMGFSRIVTFPLRHPRILLVEQQVPLGPHCPMEQLLTRLHVARLHSGRYSSGQQGIVWLFRGQHQLN